MSPFFYSKGKTMKIEMMFAAVLVMLATSCCVIVYKNTSVAVQDAAVEAIVHIEVGSYD